MWLVVGLGNPGAEYRKNRHNLGFMVVEKLAAKAGFPPWKEKWKGQWSRGTLAGDDVVLLLPQTYMNLSGESVQPALAFFKLPLDRLLVVHDELDLPFRDVRVKIGGGTAGNKGIKSVVERCGDAFPRVRIGIGRPPRGPVDRWVLSDFSPEESAWLPDVLETASLAAETVVRSGPQAAQNQFNARPKPTA
jgi:PTH1 family peptidyl-tRNA hydrolase